MPTVLRHELQGCDGYRVESATGVLGWVEETWLGPTSEPAALAVRTSDGRRRLLLAEGVDAVLPADHLVLVHSADRVLELDVVPHAEPAAAEATGRPLWEVVAILYGALALIVGFVMAISFLASYIVSGWVY